MSSVPESLAPALAEAAWPGNAAGELIAALGDAARLTGHAIGKTPPQQSGDSLDSVKQFMPAAAASLGLEASSERILYRDLDAMLERCKAMIVLLPGSDRFLGIVRGRRGGIELLRPDRSIAKVPIGIVRAALASRCEAPVAREINQFIASAALSPRRGHSARSFLFRQRLGTVPVLNVWRLGPAPGAGLWITARALSIPSSLAAFIGANIVHYLLWLLAWTTAGRWALSGTFDVSWAWAWLLLLLTAIPFHLLSRWMEGSMSARIGKMLKQRLLTGAIVLNPDDLRTEGPSRFLSRVLESNAAETFLLFGGFGMLVGIVELAFSGAILRLGSAGWLHVLLLVIWALVLALIHVATYRRRRAWSLNRLTLTHDLVEKMVGYRTRLAQERAEMWHEGEDLSMAEYIRRSRSMDHWLTTGEVIATRGWIIVALLALIPGIWNGSAAPAGLAIAIGGILLAERGFTKCLVAGTQLVDAFIAWRQIRTLYEAAGTKRTPPPLQTARAREGTAILEAHDLSYRYPSRHDSAARGWNLTIQRGDRILLEGPSGSGKSTLCALLSCLRPVDGGLILLHGLDQHSVSEREWRRQVAAAPQFHENHVIADSFAFNLLMGRRWPPSEGDLREAVEVCEELGLGELLRKMPGGIFQLVGDTGWQLSHGEKSRLYVARSLLQRAELVILDESFAALDPQNLSRALDCVVRRAPALLVVAHP